MLISTHYIFQVSLSTEDTVSISNIDKSCDSILTMSLGMYFLSCDV